MKRSIGAKRDGAHPFALFAQGNSITIPHALRVNETHAQLNQLFLEQWHFQALAYFAVDSIQEIR
jgi:hypothetical protein